MDFAVILAFASALFAVTLAIVIAWHERRSVAHWFFLAGMAALALESIFSGLAANALLPDEIVQWQNWRMFAMSLLPGAWLCFSFSYARGNYREFLLRWRWLLGASLLLPVGLAIWFHGRLIIFAGQAALGNPWIFGLSVPGFALYLF